MAVFVEGPRNAEWLRSEANGSRSRDVLALDQSADLYITGTLVDVETGARATADSAKLAIVYLTTDATAGAVDATVISRDAEVTGDLLVRPAGVTLAAATAKLDAVGIIVR
ncbi:head decoration protein [Pleomorphomonas carboxyditropha]|nr:head decoration protein [Pleomorphomonas carboxyditropha]